MTDVPQVGQRTDKSQATNIPPENMLAPIRSNSIQLGSQIL